MQQLFFFKTLFDPEYLSKLEQRPAGPRISTIGGTSSSSSSSSSRGPGGSGGTGRRIGEISSLSSSSSANSFAPSCVGSSCGG